jgi:RimJ/RimL family protein N-acetyltransferase
MNIPMIGVTMTIDSKRVESKHLTWTLRCPTVQDATDLSDLRVKIDGETENLDREPGEGYISPKDFENLINDDNEQKNNLFLIAEVDGKIVGFTRCVGNKLSRFKHKAEFGICILKDYQGYGIGSMLLEHIINWADEIGIQKINLSVLETNEKAIQLYKKFGFVEEGLLLYDRFHKDGRYYNTIIMGRFRSQVT